MPTIVKIQPQRSAQIGQRCRGNVSFPSLPLAFLHAVQGIEQLIAQPFWIACRFDKFQATSSRFRTQLSQAKVIERNRHRVVCPNVSRTVAQQGSQDAQALVEFIDP